MSANTLAKIDDWRTYRRGCPWNRAVLRRAAGGGHAGRRRADATRVPLNPRVLAPASTLDNAARVVARST